MKNLNNTIVVLGAGIGGLTTAYQLLKQGEKVCVLDQSDQVGGLLRPVCYANYSVDLGQKQIYNRIPHVNDFLEEVLGDCWRKYPYRVGAYYKNKILEREGKFRGFFRGMNIPMITHGMFDLIYHRLIYKFKTIDSLEDQAYSNKGKHFTKIFSQGFDEKLKCQKWSEIAPKGNMLTGPAGHGQSINTLKSLHEVGSSGQQYWYHPIKGSGFLIKKLKDEIFAMGGEIKLNSRVTKIHHAKNQVQEISFLHKHKTHTYEISNLVSSIQLEALANLMNIPCTYSLDHISFQRAVIIVYFFQNEAAHFPHTCLHVTDPKLKTGRITNYAAYACDMVPEGKSCLAFEIFCKRDDNLFSKKASDLIDLVKREFSNQNLINFNQTKSSIVIKLPLGDPGTNWEDYKQEPLRMEVYKELSTFENLYNVNRTGIDKTIFAAIKASESIVAKEKELFLRLTSPEVYKPWERNPTLTKA